MQEKPEKNVVEITPQHEVPICKPSMRFLRFGKIANHMVFTCFALLIAIALSIVIVPFLKFFSIMICFIALGIMIVFSFGLVFLSEDPATAKVWNFFVGGIGNNSTLDILEFLISMIPYICIVALALSVVSITIFACNKHQHKTSRIVVTSIFAGLIAIVFVFYFLLGGSL